MNETLLRELVPAVIGVLVRRGADFAAAEDAVQDALVEAVRTWRDVPPGADGLDQCVLDGVLGRREVGSAADEDPDDRGHELPQQRLVHVTGRVTR